MNQEELHRQVEKDIADSQALIEKLKHEPLMDDDGYPTDACLGIIQTWHWSDSVGWFKFIKENWYYADWGWKEVDEPHDFKKDNIVHRYYISTAGWSGNEGIIRAMQANEMMWNFNWLQSRRGGHYIFEDYQFKVDV